MDQLIGDNLVACDDIPPVRRRVDLMRVTALPFRQDGVGAIYWTSVVGGKRYGPVKNVEDIFKAVTRDIHDTVGPGYRVGNP